LQTTEGERGEEKVIKTLQDKKAIRERLCVSKRRKTDVKKLLTGIVVLTIAGCAVAQAGEIYDANGRLIGRHSVSVYSGVDASVYRNVVRGNCAVGSCTVRTFDASGRLAQTGIRRGNVGYTYDSNGRSTGRVVYNSSNNAFRAYNNRGRLTSSGTR
jgi:YD repeat-containing protein